MIKIENKKSYRGDGVYVGRPSVLGNPFPMSDESERDAVIEKYRVWLRSEYAQKGVVYRELIALAGKHVRGEDIVLICWCHPQACHADVIREAIEGIASQM